MRKITVLVLFLLCGMLLPIFSASAYGDYDVIDYDGVEFCFDTATGTLHGFVSYDETVKNLVIPSELDGVAVTGIGYEAFRNADQLESVTIPDSVTSIAENAFFACESLKSITIPDSVTHVGECAFWQCPALKTAKLGNGMTSIPTDMFFSCEALTEITFGENITSIGKTAFYHCRALTQIVLPDRLKSIEAYAFDDCSALTSVDFGNGLETIADYAFTNCSSLTSITLPDSVTSLGECAFNSCNALKSIKIGKGLSSLGEFAYPAHVRLVVDEDNEHFSTDESYALYNKDKTALIRCPIVCEGSYTIAETVTHIAPNAFHGCDLLTQIEFGKNVKTIGSDAFHGTGLTKLTIPDSVTHIDQSAFSDCPELKEVTIGKNVESIEELAFSNCPQLNSIDVASENEHYCTDTFGILYDKKQTVLLQAPTTFCGAYTAPESLKSIHPRAFYNCTGLTSIVMPEGMTTIGKEAFAYCEALESIALPDSLEPFSSVNFYSTAYYMDETNWDDGILYIGNHLVESISESPKVIVREGTRTISPYAFVYGDQTEIVLPESLVSIGKLAFNFCDIESITIPKNIRSIAADAFDSCIYLREFCVDAENEHYSADKNGVLFDKQKTTLLHFPTSAGRKYTIPDGVTTVVEGAFNDVYKLAVLTIPKSVRTIGAFETEESRVIDVYYTGSESDWKKVDISEENRAFFEMSIHHDYVSSENLSGTTAFKDVKNDAYFATPVLWANANKITTGISATRFAPNRVCTRAQIITFLWRLKGCPEPADYTNPFVDIEQSAYYYKAVLWAYENHFIYGTSENTFSPNDSCTRGQVALMLYRISYDNGTTQDNPFTDIAESDDYYDCVLWAYNCGITTGVSADKFAPNDPCTRAQIVTFLFRTFA